MMTLRSVWCRLHGGHDDTLKISATHEWLECCSCGRTTAGISIAPSRRIARMFRFSGRLLRFRKREAA